MESMQRVSYFNAVDSLAIVEGLGMRNWLVGFRVEVLAAVEDAMVIMTLGGIPTGVARSFSTG